MNETLIANSPRTSSSLTFWSPSRRLHSRDILSCSLCTRLSMSYRELEGRFTFDIKSHGFVLILGLPWLSDQINIYDPWPWRALNLIIFLLNCKIFESQDNWLHRNASCSALFLFRQFEYHICNSNSVNVDSIEPRTAYAIGLVIAHLFDVGSPNARIVCLLPSMLVARGSALILSTARL